MNEKRKIAIIMRSDEIIDNFKLKRITVNTSFGPVNRCFEGYIYDVPVVIIYGRFNGIKVPSGQINYEQIIEVVKNVGATELIGTFVVGGINPEMPQGSVYILGDLVGFGNYNINWNRTSSFHNAEMYEPFCPSLNKQLEAAAKKMSFNVKKNAIYVSFNGWPRIETKAELDFYNRQKWDIVGQTCDPEATLARLNSICYAAVAVQIDDPKSRSSFVNDLKQKGKADNYIESVESCRKRTSQLVLQFLKDYKQNDCNMCNKMVRKNNYFRELPNKYYD